MTYAEMCEEFADEMFSYDESDVIAETYAEFESAIWDEHHAIKGMESNDKYAFRSAYADYKNANDRIENAYAKLIAMGEDVLTKF